MPNGDKPAERQVLPLQQIRPPIDSPTDTPDHKTESETREYDFARVKALRELDPTGRHLAVTDELIETLRQGSDRHHKKCEELASELNTLRPQYAALSESHRAASWQSIGATAAMAVGAIFIGDPDRVNLIGCSEHAIVGCGWGILVIGLIGLCAAQIIARCWKSPFDN